MKNRGVIKIDRFTLTQLLGLPDEYDAVAAHYDYQTSQLIIVVEGPGILEVPEGEYHPTIQLVDHFMTDANGRKWTRREIKTITGNDACLEHHINKDSATL